MATKFQTPNNSETYYSLIKKRCENLINHQIWSGIDRNTLNLWLKNFITPEEKYFAACILDNLLFRSKEQTDAMLFQLFSRSIPDVLRKTQPPIPKVILLDILKGNIDYKIRLVPLLQDEDPTQSGYAISRLIKLLNYCNKKWIITPSQIQKSIKTGAKVFIFIDDFLGTGTQFSKVAIKINLKSLLKNHYIMYAPLAAHETGIKNITSNFPNLKIATSELLRNDSNVFHSCFDDSVNTPEIVESFYNEFLIKKGIKEKIKLSRFNLHLAYAFEHGVPNNSLKIFYQKKNWNQLFNR